MNENKDTNNKDINELNPVEIIDETSTDDGKTSSVEFAEAVESQVEIIEENDDIEIVDETQTEMTERLHKFSSNEKPVENARKKKPTSVLIILLAGVVALAVIIGGILLLNGTESENDDSTSSLTSADISQSVNEDNVWEAYVNVDSDGNIAQNGTAVFVDYIPSDISRIDITNESGSFAITSYTPVSDDGTTETTQYTLVGYEDFELQSGMPDGIANDCCAPTITKIIEVDAKDLSIYGLDNPRAVATITYSDKTKAVVTVGNNAPQSSDTYIMFGTENTVYLAESNYVDTLLYSVNDLLSLTVNYSVSVTSDSEFDYIKLSGKAYGDDVITLKYNDEPNNLTASYMITTPEKAYADNEKASLVTGGVRGIYASAVVCANPTAKDLKKYGLADNYAYLKAKYPDTTIKLLASKPDDNNMCYIMVDGGRVIYEIDATSIYWVLVDYESLCSDYVWSPNIEGLTSMTIDDNTNSYKFNLKTTTTETTDDEGNTSSSTSTVVKYDGEELTLSYFETFFANATLLEMTDKTTASSSGKPVLTLTYTYEKGRSKDVVRYYSTDSNKYLATVNGKTVGLVYSSYVNKIIEQAPKMAKDISVASFW